VVVNQAVANNSLCQLVYDDLIARGRTLNVAKEWSAIAAEFEQVCGYKEIYTRADLTLYLGHLRKRGLLQSTINKNLKTIKLLSQIQGWDYPKLSFRKVSPDEVKRPIFTKEHVQSLILIGKTLFESVELCYLALSTVYGLRRIEMARLKDTDFTPEMVTIHTAKGGRVTTHLIPEQIAPYLKSFKPYRNDTLTHMFHQLMVKSGLNATGGFGWHAIRRALATELVLSGASTLNVLRFMRWSEATLKGELGMLPIYAIKDQARIDQEIFTIHPFLPYWGEAWN
jgi:integrase